MLERPPPPTGRSPVPVDRTVVPRAADTPYGQGVFRRRIRLVSASADRTVGELEDDFHHFRVELRHDGTTIGEATGRELRSPWTTCAQAGEPLRAIEGHPLSARSTAVGAYAPARRNCTHLFDLAGLAVAHAARGSTGATRQYDLELTDPCGPARSQRATLWRDGAQVLAWELEQGEIVAPARWKGAPLRQGFIAWAESTLPPDEAEAAVALRRIVDIAIGRGADLDLLERADVAASVMMGRCHTYQPGVVELALRNRGSARDFRDRPELLLADMELRG